MSGREAERGCANRVRDRLLAAAGAIEEGRTADAAADIEQALAALALASLDGAQETVEALAHAEAVLREEGGPSDTSERLDAADRAHAVLERIADLARLGYSRTGAPTFVHIEEDARTVLAKAARP